MESSFKVLLLVFTLVFAQNTTQDYDDETTAMEETSTENITELPPLTTTMKSVGSTVLPEQMNLVSFLIIFFIFFYFQI